MRLNSTYLLMIMSLFVTACSNSDRSDLENFVKHEQSLPANKIPPLPEFVQYKMFAYQGYDIRDPFVPVVDVEIVTKRGYSGPRPDENRIKEPLENFSLDSLRMMGTLIQKQTTWILLKDPDGLLHRVTIGNYVGLNNGKIIGLEEDSIEIEEFVADGNGWQQRKAGISMSIE